MRFVSFVIAVTLPLASLAQTPAQSGQAQKTVSVFVQGDTSRLADFVESCRREFADRGLKLQLVSSDGEFQYNVVIAQESSVSGAAAAVVALDRKGVFCRVRCAVGENVGKGGLKCFR
jgi:hypothetical protein